MYYVKLKSPFSLKWGITLAGSSLDLADATLRVLLKNARGSIDITDYITDISNNVIKAAIPGLNYLGEYSFQLRVESASTPTFELNERYALKVVDKLDVEGPIEVVINSTIRINDGKELDEAISTTSANAVQNKAIGKKFEEERDLTNSQIESAVGELDAYINDRISSVQAEIDNNYNALMAVLNNKYEEFNREINGRLAIFTDETNERLDSSDQKMKEFRDTLNNSFITFKGELSNSLATYKGELYNLFASFQESIEGDYNDFKNGTINTVADFKSHITARVDEFENTINSQFREFKIALNNSFGSFVEEAQAGYLEFQNEFRVTYAEFTSGINSSLESFKSNINSTLSSYQSSLNQTINDRFSQQDSAIREIASANESFREEQAGVMEEFQSRVSDEVAKKVSYDGKYPQLTSGFANNLVGRGESTESEFTFRASGGKSIEDGAARIAELRGNGVVWNQSLENGDFSKGKQYWGVMNNNSFVVEDGVATITLESVPTSGAYAYLVTESNTKCIVGHKYYVSAEGNIPRQTTLEISSSRLSLLTPNAVTPAINTWTRVAAIAEGIMNASATFAFYAKQTVGGWEVGDQYKVRNYQFIDLTLMFGAGNEPTTIEEFYARMPIGVDEYAYNEGTLIPFNADGIKSVGFNAWDGAMEEGVASDINGTIGKVQNSLCTDFVRILPNNDYFIRTDATSGRWGAWYDSNKQYISGIAGGGIKTSPANAAYMRMTIVENGNGNPDTFCINLSHTGYRNGEYQPYEDFVRAIDPRIREAFPNGMKPWDKVYNKNGKGYIVKGSGKEDLGKLSYYVGGTTNGDARMASTTEIADIARIDAATIGKIVCSKYVANSANNVYMNTIGIAVLSTGGLSIYDPSYTDAAAFKAAMAGVPLWYELADEYKEVIEYDEPFNLDYTVWDFGTEEILSEQPSAPISADIIYQFNAVDTIRNNQIEIAQLKAMIATMQAQMASLTSQTNLEE